MTATNHALTGAVIALAVKQPVLALPLALLSHFVCDAIPHWDYNVKLPKRRLIITGDLFLAIALVALIAVLGSTFAVKPLIVAACAFLAVLPDAMWLPHILKGQPIPFDGDEPLYLARRFHRWIQWSETKKGLYLEIAWLIALSAFVILRYLAITNAPK